MAENKLSTEKKVLILVIVLFALVAVLSVASYLASVKNISPVAVQSTEEPTVAPTLEPTIEPTPNIDMSDWQTYKNEKYGFEVSHPVDWSVYESPELESEKDPAMNQGPAVAISLVSPDKQGYILGPYLPNKFAPKNWEEVNSFIAPMISIQGAVKNEITFNGHKAYEVINRPGDRNEVHKIYFLYNGYFFILQSSPFGGIPEPLLSQIVSTFRFTK